MEQSEFDQLAKATARAITAEKKRESVGVWKVIGAVLLAWIVGAAAESIAVGVVTALLLFIPIWQAYSGSSKLDVVALWIRRGFWGFAGLIALVFIGIQVMLFFDDTPPVAKAPIAAPSPQQIRKQQIQAAINQGEVNLIAHIKTNMGDPDSFELVSDRAIDGGDHITMVMVYRGRNGFNALRLEKVGAAFDLQGNIISIQEIE